MRNRLFALGLTVAVLATLVFAPPSEAAPVDIYAETVMADSPSIWYRFNETAGTTIADSSGNGRGGSLGTYNSSNSFALGTTGGPSGPSEKSATATDCGFAVSSYTFPAPVPVSQEVWFKTTTIYGGVIAGLGNASSGISTDYDRRIYMNNNGTVGFKVYSGSERLITSSRSYNDGSWHLASSTFGPSGMKLYVDGSLQATNPGITTANAIPSAFWRLGCDQKDGAGTNYSHWGFEGQIDDAALYLGSELSTTRVAAHYAAAFGGSAEATVSTAVDPSMSFTISGRSTACNGETRTGTATGSTVALGRASAGAPVSAGQDLLVSTNAASGWKLMIRTAAPLSDGQGNTIPHTPAVGPAAFPASGTAAFAYTFSWMVTPNTWYQPNATTGDVFNAPSFTPTATGCVAYQAQASSSTPAGNYSTTVTWTLVPRF